MGQKTGIEWTDATWNPVTGCTRVSAGCDNCYAATLANRLLKTIYLERDPVVDSENARIDPFAVRLWPERIHEPMRWTEPRKIFVNSMSDLFHAEIPDEFVRDVFTVMIEANWHVYQVLTKRPSRVQRFFERHQALFETGHIPDHIWIGTSVENQDVAYRIRHLRAVPAATRFLSCEPLIGPLTINVEGIDWVIVGGESGIRRRPIEEAWVRAIRDQCIEAQVPFFFKQWGGTPKAGGRKLDGVLWSEMPHSPSWGR
jgi:protein gp37